MPTRKSSFYSKLLVSLFIFPVACVLTGCLDSGPSDHSSYTIRILSTSVDEADGEYETWKEHSSKEELIQATLYENVDSSGEFGYVSVFHWPDYETMRFVHNYAGKPEDTQVRPYKVVATATGSNPGENVAEHAYVVNFFDIPAQTFGEADPLPQWELIAEFMGDQEGFISASFYMSILSDASYRYVSVAKWRNAEDFLKVKQNTDNLFGQVMKFTDLDITTNIYKMIEHHSSS